MIAYKSFISYKPLIVALALISASIANIANAQSDGIAAVVNNSVILQSELTDATTALTQQYQAQNRPIPSDINQKALDLLIANTLQLDLLKNAKIEPNDHLINQQLTQIATEQGFNDLQSFAQSLENEATGNFEALRQELINKNALETLQQSQVNARIKLNPKQVDTFLNSPAAQILNPTEYRTFHIRVPYLDDISRISNEQKQQTLAAAERLRQALQTNDPRTAIQQAQVGYSVNFQGADTGYNERRNLPPALSGIITALPVGGVSEPILTKEGVDVVKLLDKRNEPQVLLNEWQTSHILIKVDNTQPSAVAEQKINGIYSALQQGASFEQLASAYSDDKASAANQGRLGWVAEQQMVPAFETVMKNTAKGTYSTPFATQFGYHILKVDDTRKRDISQEFLRTKAEAYLFERTAPYAFEDWIQELKSNAYIHNYINVEP